MAGFTYKLLLFITLFPALTLAKTHQVQMLNASDGQSMLFKPGYLKIESGDQVIFIPTDKGHNSQSVFIPENAKKWKGKNNEKITLNFEKEGIYIYECKNHSIMGMAGIIQVDNPVNLEQTKKFLETYKKKFVLNKNRMDKYLEKIN